MSTLPRSTNIKNGTPMFWTNIFEQLHDVSRDVIVQLVSLERNDSLDIGYAGTIPGAGD